MNPQSKAGSESQPASLSLSHRLLRLLISLNIVFGVLIFALLVATFVAPDAVFRALLNGATVTVAVMRGGRGIMVLGIAAVPVTHIVLTRLLAIVDTVRAGDPFVVTNAERLQTIAWSLLGLQVMNIAIGVITKGLARGNSGVDMDWSFSITPWLAVLLMFVLARVFEHGARMREELQGTI